MSVPEGKQIWFACILPVILIVLLTSSLAAFQKKETKSVVPAVLLTRTTSRHETSRLGYGGSLTIVGAPNGSITIEGWQRSEVDVSADIELKAETEPDLDKLATVNGFMLDEDLNHIRVLTLSTQDREYMKRKNKNFPKTLMNLPWKIDYRIRVPAVTDIEINAGHGPLRLAGVEGALRISATESDTELVLTGGIVSATITAGNVRLAIPTRSWRGGGADIRIAGGVLNVEMTPGFNGDIDADILRNGKIVNAYEELAAREKPGITERVVRARAGAGGAFFKFTVVDGTINLLKKAVQ